MAMGLVCWGEGLPVEIPLVKKAPTLMDASFEGAMRVDVFVQREPRDGEKPSRNTVAYVSRDARNLYVVFECEAGPGEVRAHMAKREQIAEDDSVGVFLDSHHDQRNAYFFYSNPLGVPMDGITKEGQGDDASFDTVFASQGRLTEKGYRVLVAIPFRSIRSSGNATTWGMALTRFSPHTNELVTWPRISRGKEGFVRHFAEVVAPAGANTRLPLTMTPYFFGSQGIARAGLDAQLAIKNQFNLDITFNPDFSQVEADDPANTVNQRFEVFFPEKRPFFRDHANFFQTPETLFFSRRILMPSGGVRFSGTAGNWSTGMLAVRDTVDDAQVTVARVERSWAGKGSLGGIYLQRDARDVGDGLGTHNRVAAVDGRWRLNEHWAATAQITRTEATRGGGAMRQGGYGSYFNVKRTGNNFHFATTYRERSPGFEDELGYIPRVNTRQLLGSTGYTFRPEKGKLLGVGPSVTYMLIRDWQGRVMDWSVAVPLWIDLTRSTTIALEREESYETYDGRGFRKHGHMVYVTSDPFAWLGAFVSHRQGDGINYDPVPGMRAFGGKAMEQTGGISLRPWTRLRVDPAWVRSSLDSKKGPVYTNQVYRVKVQYQFSRAFSVRTIVDRNALRYDAGLFDASKVKPYAYDVLAAWQSMSGWSFYVGVADRQQRWDVMERRQGVTAYSKISYQFRP